MEEELLSQKDCLRLEAARGEPLWFSTPAHCLKHLLDRGFHYAGGCLQLEGPLAGGVDPGGLPPQLETLCAAREDKYFVNESVQSGGQKSSPHLRLHISSDEQDLSGHVLYACAFGLPNALQLVFDSGNAPDLNIALPDTNEHGLSPLAVASLCPSPPVCELLITHGANVNWTNNLGRSALHWAVLGSNLQSVRLLLKHGASTTLVDSQGFTPLLYASIIGTPDMVSALLKEGCATVDQPHEPTGVTALMCACVRGRDAVVRALLKHHADVTLCDRWGLSALHCAVWAGNLQCVKHLFTRGSRALLDLRDQWGRSVLLAAAAKGDPVLLQYLVKKKGAVWSDVDQCGRTALHWAVLSQQVSCVEMIVDKQSGGGGDLCTQPDNSGATPAHYAAMNGREDILSILKAKGASLSVLDHSGFSPLLWAAAFGRVGVVKMLLNDGGIPSNLDEVGERESSLQPLHAAACVGAEGVCQSLLEAGAKVDVTSSAGLTPLHLACQYGHSGCVKVLLAAGAPVDALTPQQESSLHLASIHGCAAAVQELLVNGAQRDRLLGATENHSIHLASLHGHMEVLKVLLNNGCAVDESRPSDLRTPLHLCSAQGHLTCCQLLVSRGANMTLRDGTMEGFTALDLAMLNVHASCVAYLVSVQAPTGAGKYHRAALTIQTAWKFHRHKRRWGVARQWAAVVIQQAVRHWLARCRAQRVRKVRERVRNRAASLIQHHWQLYIQEKRRYEATYTRLKAKLEQERLATSLILSDLHDQAHNIQLPPAVRVKPFTLPNSPAPSYLLKASSNPPLPIFPSGSLLFPSHPHKPLINKLPIIRIVEEGSTPTPTAATPSSFPTMCKPTPSSLPTVYKAIPSSLPTAHEAKPPTVCKATSPSLPTICEASEERLHVTLNQRSRFPPIPTSHSLTAPHNPITVGISRGSPKPIKPKQPVCGVSRTQKTLEKSGGSGRGPITKLPSIPQNNSAVSPPPLPSKSDSPPVLEEQKMAGLKTASGTQVHKKQSTAESKAVSDTPIHKEQTIAELETTTFPPVSQSSHTVSSCEGRDKVTSGARHPPHKDDETADRLHDPPTMRVPAQSYVTRQSTFKETPLGYKPTHSRRLKERSREIKDDGGDAVDSPVKQQLLRQAQRYTKLSEVLSLLQQAREAQKLTEGEGEGVRASELKQHIKTALDEAIRLRADTEALQSSMHPGRDSQLASTVNS